MNELKKNGTKVCAFERSLEWNEGMKENKSLRVNENINVKI